MSGLAFAIVLALASEAPAPVRRMEDFGDPIGNYNFQLEIDGVDAGQFTGVDGLSVEQEVIEYRSGDDNLVRKVPGRIRYGDIVLTREYVGETVFRDWLQMAEDGQPERRDAALLLQEIGPGRTILLATWQLRSCFPRKLLIQSNRNPKGFRILEEHLTLSCNILEEISPPEEN